jgi:hypothetical protein
VANCYGRSTYNHTMAVTLRSTLLECLQAEQLNLTSGLEHSRHHKTRWTEAHTLYASNDKQSTMTITPAIDSQRRPVYSQWFSSSHSSCTSLPIYFFAKSVQWTNG